MKGWLSLATENGVACLPLRDLITHEPDGEDCVCGPSSEPIFREDGTTAWLLMHHSLDGRERTE